MFSEDKRIIGTKRYAQAQKMFSEAGLFAIRDAKERGLPITYVRDNKIIKEYADGSEEILGEADPFVSVKKKVYIVPERDAKKIQKK
jgi:hypothetical protein